MTTVKDTREVRIVAEAAERAANRVAFGPAEDIPIGAVLSGDWLVEIPTQFEINVRRTMVNMRVTQVIHLDADDLGRATGWGEHSAPRKRYTPVDSVRVLCGKFSLPAAGVVRVRRAPQ